MRDNDRTFFNSEAFKARLSGKLVDLDDYRPDELRHLRPADAQRASAPHALRTGAYLRR